LQNALGLLAWLVLPVLAGSLAIFLPFKFHRKTRHDGLLTLGIINGIFCGLAILTLAVTWMFDLYPTLLPHLIIGAGLLADVVVLAKSRAKIKRAPPSSPLIDPSHPTRRSP
jgi:hypothetical protein